MRADDSIFRTYYTPPPFVDRFETERDRAVDIIVPVIHTNELWRSNLLSFYREVPVNRLLIGDGGCIDGSIDVAREFPRVVVCDHRDFKTLGYSIRKLIEAVETDWFLYLHSDVFLPTGWFDEMARHQGEYDWYGCRMQHTVMVQYEVDYGPRPWAGAQMGRREAFGAGLAEIADDYVYRQEDFVFADLVKRDGFREGRVAEAFHFHQTMRKPSPWERSVTAVQISVQTSQAEEDRTWIMQTRGIIKYLHPDEPWLIDDAVHGAHYLLSRRITGWRELSRWVLDVNPEWLPHLRRGLRRRRFQQLLSALRKTLASIPH